MGALAKNWESLTWDELEEWAGARSVSRGQAYQRQRHVTNLVRSDEGRLLANVIGGELYVVSVWLDAQGGKRNAIESRCTCPVGVACKHAVAVIAEYMDFVAKRKAVPSSTVDDPRWQELATQDAGSPAGDDDDMDEAGGKEGEIGAGSGGRASHSASRQKLHEKIQQHIRAKSQQELADLVWSLTERFPELRDEFRERVALGEGNVHRLVTEAKRELHRITAEPGWVNSWSGEGSVPDYSKLIHRLERLLLAGHADAVLELGREIIERGIAQVGQSNDEGETGEAFAKCLPIIFEAVTQSSLSPAEQLLFVIDAELEDEYGLIGDAADLVTDEDFEPVVWSQVADELRRRLVTSSVPKAGNDFHRNYQRDQVTNWLGSALQNANRSEEALTLYEQEARKTGSYERLVRFLIDEKRYDDAQRWAREGIEKTAAKLPGIAAHLAEALSDLARVRHRWDEAAAYVVSQFFDRPSRETFEKLITAATKAECQDKVRELALRFLESGISPVSKTGSRAARGESGAEWPLPTPDYLQPLILTGERHRPAGPHYGVLIDIAIAEKHTEEVLRWYDKLCASKENKDLRSPWSPLSEYPDRVAEAVAHSHPDRSLEIYRGRLSENLNEAKKSAYETVVAYLRKMRTIMKTLDRENEWHDLIADIRSRHHNRPRFVEMLDRLDGGTILQAQKARHY